MGTTRRQRSAIAAVAAAIVTATATIGGAAPAGGAPGAITVSDLAPGVAFAPSQVNDRGRVLGQRFTGDEYQWCVYERGRLTPLTPLTAPTTLTEAVMNGRGDVAGTTIDYVDVVAPSRPFLWVNGRSVDLRAVGNARVVGLNDRRQVLLQPRPPVPPDDPTDPALRPRVWAGGQVTVSPAPPAGTVFELPDGDLRWQPAISATGLVAGSLRSLRDGSAEAAVWRPGGPVVGLGGLGPAGSWAYAVSPSGVVAGLSDGADGRGHVFVWRTATGMVDIGLPDPMTASLGIEAMSDRGHLVVSDSARRWLWHDGRFSEIGPATDARVWAVNDRDQVLLQRFGGPDARSGSFVWQDGALTGLPGSPAAESMASVPADLNGQGLAVGTADDGRRGLLWHISR